MSATPGRNDEENPAAPAPSAPLDRLLEEQRRAEARRRRRETPTVVALALFGVTGIVFGRSQPLAVFLGAWVLGAAAAFFFGARLRDREEQGSGERGRIDTGTVGGQPAVVLHRHPAREQLAAAFTAYVGVLLVGGGLVAQRHPTAAYVIGTLLVSVPFLAVAVRRLARARQDGVLLTPDSLVVRAQGTVYSTRWDEVAAVSEAHSPTCLVVVLPRSMAALTVTGRDRGARRGSAHGDIPIRTGSLAVAAPDLVEIIWRFREPGNRPVLATSDGPDAVRRIAAARS